MGSHFVVHPPGDKKIRGTKTGIYGLKIQTKKKGSLRKKQKQKRQYKTERSQIGTPWDHTSLLTLRGIKKFAGQKRASTAPKKKIKKRLPKRYKTERSQIGTPWDPTSLLTLRGIKNRGRQKRTITSPKFKNLFSRGYKRKRDSNGTP